MKVEIRATIGTLFAGFVFSFFAGGAATADDAAAQALLTSHRGAVVQLLVKGKVNNQTTLEKGTGFLVQTGAGPRIITAGHVVGPDNKWDSLLDRCIYYRLAQNGSSLAYDCVVDARVAPNIDFAEVYLDDFSPPTLDIASALPAEGTDLAVTSWRSWGQPGSRATAQAARLLHVASDHMDLSGTYERSDSGSPVLDSQGKVVGLMIEASMQPGGTTQGTALPVTRFAAALAGPIALSKTLIPALGEIVHNKIIVDATAVLAEAGCVFLGKRSARVTHKPEDMPFGPALLESLGSDEGRRSLIGKSLLVQTTVNLRRDCPAIMEGSAYYTAVRGKLAPKDTVVPNEILPLNYLDDTYYWARGLGTATSRPDSDQK